MSKVYVTSDPHFGHENIAKHRGFSSAREMDDLIITNWNKTINKRDVVWILGDITMEKGGYGVLSYLHGIKKVVLGNHDKPQHVQRLLTYVNKVCGALKYRDCIFTHVPIHPQELRKFRYNIHGHVHDKTVPDDRYINVCVDVRNYTPVLLDELIG